MLTGLRQIGKFFLSIEIWMVGLAVAVSIFSTRALGWAVGLAVSYWILRWIVEGRRVRRTAADFGIGLLILMIPVTLWVTPLPEVTTLQVLRLLTGIFLFYALIHWMNTPERSKWALWGVIGVSMALSVGAFFGVEWAADKIPFIPAGIYRFFTTTLADTANPNVLAGSLVIVFPFAPCLLLFSWREISKGERILMVLAAIFSSGVLILSQSRSALIALAVIFALMLSFRWRWGWLLLLAVGLLAVIVFGVFGETVQQGILLTVRSSLKLEQRLEIWSRAIFMIRDFPFTGIGMGSFGEVTAWFYPFLQNVEAGIPHAHNLFLQVAVDLGIPGLFAWLSILAVVTVASWRIYRAGTQSRERLTTTLGVSLLCSQAALIANGMTDAVTWGMVRPAPLVWALWGIAIAAWNILQPRRVSDIFQV